MGVSLSYHEAVDRLDIKAVAPRPHFAGKLRIPGIGLAIAAIALGVIQFMVTGGAPSVNVLVASAALAVLGALLIAVSLAAHVFEAHDLASLHSLAEETRRNVDRGLQMAKESRANRRDNSAVDDEPIRRS